MKTLRLGVGWLPLTAVVLAFLVVLACGAAGAQNLPYLRHQAWSTEDGLPQDSVSEIAQTADGYLWVATEGGLARFDGLTFKTFTHANERAFVSDDICCLLTDSADSLWIGTSDGLLRLRAGHFTRFTEANGLPSATIRGLARRRDGSARVTTMRGVATWADGQFVTEGESPGSSDPSATLGRLPPGWSYSHTAVTLSSAGLIERWTIGRELPGSRVETLFVDREGTAWVGTNKGLVTLKVHASQVTAVPWLQGNIVQQVFEDREGNYWIGTETSGLHVLRPVKFRTIPGLADQEVTAVAPGQDGAVWVGTRREGLRLARGDLLLTPAAQARLTSPLILSLASGEHGSVWAGTPDGLDHVSAEGAVEQITSASGLPDDFVQTLANDGHGGVWAGTRRGLVHLGGPAARDAKVYTTAEGLGGDLIGALLAARNGELWIGTSGGLTRRDRDGRFTTPHTGPGSGERLVTAFAEDDEGGVWASFSDGSLSRFFQGKNHSLPRFAAAGEIDGMALDTRGALWLRNRRGVDRVPLTGLEECMHIQQPCVPPVSHYGLPDGLPSLEVVQGTAPVVARMGNGELWFGTRRGLAITDPAHLAENLLPPPVVIQRFLADDVALETASAPLRIPFGPVRFTIDYAGLSFTAPTEVRYRYRLEGLEEGWTEAGARRSATYTNLRPQPYVFRVQAMNNDGVWNETGATLPFSIVPPFYRRWWFLLLLLLGLALLVAALYRLRLRSLQLRFEAVLGERNRMAREIHDTLAQDFVGVSLQLDLIAQLLGRSNVEAAATQVRQTRRLVTDGLAEARRSIWELRANVARDSLPTRLATVVERYTSEPLRIDLKLGGAYRKLDDTLEAEVLRIAQEAISNVARHSGAELASVSLQYGSDMLVLIVQDDGRGFDVASALRSPDRFGVRGLRERAAAIGATLEVNSEPNAGTTVTLSSPIPGVGR